MELWQRFTHRARRSILIAHDEASQMRMNLIGTEHLLLGLIRMGEGAATEILRSLDVDLEQLRDQLRRAAQMGAHEEPTNEISFTPEAQRVLQIAYSQAREMGDAHIGTEHLLLALAQEGRGAAYRALRKHGVNSKRVSAAMMQFEREAPEAGEQETEMSYVGGREALSSDRIPPAVGPYSQAVRAGEFIFCSGVVGLSPETGKLVEGEFADEVRQVMSNLGALLGDCGSGFDRVVKTTVFLTDMAQFQEFNGIYAEYFDDAPPARSTVQVAALPLGARLEVEAIALA